MYRDDRDAMLARAAALEAELDERREQIDARDEQLQDAEHQLADQRAELTQLRERLAELEPEQVEPPTPQNNKNTAMVTAALMAGLVAIGVLVAVVMAPSKQPHSVRVHFDARPAIAMADGAIPSTPACSDKWVGTLLEEKRHQLWQCKQRHGGAVQGTLHFAWLVMAHGDHDKLRFGAGSAVSKPFANCIEGRLRYWRNTPPQGICRAHVSVPMVAQCPTSDACSGMSVQPLCCEQHRANGGLSNKQVALAMDRVRTRVEVCAKKTGGRGTVQVTVTVNKHGRAGNITTANASVELSVCIATALAAAAFPASRDGATFTYPFVLAQP